MFFVFIFCFLFWTLLEDDGRYSRVVQCCLKMREDVRGCEIMRFVLQKGLASIFGSWYNQGTEKDEVQEGKNITLRQRRGVESQVYQ